MIVKTEDDKLTNSSGQLTPRALSMKRYGKQSSNHLVKMPVQRQSQTLDLDAVA